MNWYKVTLSNDVAEHTALRDAFEALFVASGAPKDAGMFDAIPEWTHVYYFSPGAARIAMALINHYAGVECSGPAKSDVGVIISCAGSDEIPFAMP